MSVCQSWTMPKSESFVIDIQIRYNDIIYHIVSVPLQSMIWCSKLKAASLVRVQTWSNSKFDIINNNNIRQKWWQTCPTQIWMRVDVRAVGFVTYAAVAVVGICRGVLIEVIPSAWISIKNFKSITHRKTQHLRRLTHLVICRNDWKNIWSSGTISNK